MKTVIEYVYEKNGRFYRICKQWSEKYGLYICGSPHRISKKEYEESKIEEREKKN